jgi:hypothetical protein
MQTLSRVGSAKSQKSVAWSTSDSEAALIGKEEKPDAPGKSCGQKVKNSVRWFFEIFSGMWSSREMLLDNSDKQGRDSPIFLQFFYLFSIFFLSFF